MSDVTVKIESDQQDVASFIVDTSATDTGVSISGTMFLRAGDEVWPTVNIVGGNLNCENAQFWGHIVQKINIDDDFSLGTCVE